VIVRAAVLEELDELDECEELEELDALEELLEELDTLDELDELEELAELDVLAELEELLELEVEWAVELIGGAEDVVTFSPLQPANNNKTLNTQTVLSVRNERPSPAPGKCGPDVDNRNCVSRRAATEAAIRERSRDSSKAYASADLLMFFQLLKRMPAIGMLVFSVYSVARYRHVNVSTGDQCL
jgi:hypothetical protein